MTCPINAVRNFKAERNEKTTDNVVNIKREAPIAAMHFARADEADSIEVTIMNENNETITCEELSMNNVNNEATNANMNAADDTVQVEELSMAEVATRTNTLNRKSVIMHAGMAIGTAATIMATAKKYGRNETVGAIVAGITGTLVMVAGVGQTEKSKNRAIAEQASEEDYAEAKTISVVNDIIPTAIGTVLFGALVGRFLVKKAVDAE